MWCSTRFSALLCVIYINDIGNAVANDTIKLFADDTNLFIFGDNIMSVQNEGVHSITALNNWFICNMLSLNLSKTCYTTFFANTASHCNLIVNGQTTEKVNRCKYLGIIIDDALKWNLHIQNIDLLCIYLFTCFVWC